MLTCIWWNGQQLQKLLDSIRSLRLQWLQHNALWKISLYVHVFATERLVHQTVFFFILRVFNKTMESVILPFFLKTFSFTQSKCHTLGHNTQKVLCVELPFMPQKPHWSLHTLEITVFISHFLGNIFILYILLTGRQIISAECEHADKG